MKALTGDLLGHLALGKMAVGCAEEPTSNVAPETAAIKRMNATSCSWKRNKVRWNRFVVY